MIFELQYSKLCLLASNTGGIKPRRVPDKEAKLLALVINKSTSPDLYIVLVQTLWLVKMYEELFFQTKKGAYWWTFKFPYHACLIKTE